MEGITANANAGNAARWDWMPSATNARLVQDRQMAHRAALPDRSAGAGSRSTTNTRSAARARRSRVGSEGCHNRGDDWVGLGTTGQSPEATGTAARGYFEWPFHLTQGQWTMPATNRLLFEANMTVFRYNPAFGFPPPDGITNLIPVTEQSTDLRCTGAHRNIRRIQAARSGNPAHAALGTDRPTTSTARSSSGDTRKARPTATTGSASYVTGSHNMKVGYQYYWLRQLDKTIAAENQLAYRVQRGVANQVTYRLPDVEP